MSGFAAMGMEILWFRHLTILLAGFRAVFSLLLTVILIGIGGLARFSIPESPHDPASDWLMVGQGSSWRSPSSDWPCTDASDIGASTANPAYRAALAGVADSRLPEQSGLAAHSLRSGSTAGRCWSSWPSRRC